MGYFILLALAGVDLLIYTCAILLATSDDFNKMLKRFKRPLEAKKVGWGGLCLQIPLIVASLLFWYIEGEEWELRTFVFILIPVCGILFSIFIFLFKDIFERIYRGIRS